MERCTRLYAYFVSVHSLPFCIFEDFIVYTHLERNESERGRSSGRSGLCAG